MVSRAVRNAKDGVAVGRMARKAGLLGRTSSMKMPLALISSSRAVCASSARLWTSHVHGPSARFLTVTAKRQTFVSKQGRIAIWSGEATAKFRSGMTSRDLRR